MILWLVDDGDRRAASRYRLFTITIPATRQPLQQILGQRSDGSGQEGLQLLPKLRQRDDRLGACFTGFQDGGLIDHAALGQVWDLRYFEELDPAEWLDADNRNVPDLSEGPVDTVKRHGDDCVNAVDYGIHYCLEAVQYAVNDAHEDLATGTEYVFDGFPGICENATEPVSNSTEGSLDALPDAREELPGVLENALDALPGIAEDGPQAASE